MSQYVTVKASGALSQAEVISLQGRMALSQPYHFEVCCDYSAVKNLNISSLMGESITLTVTIENQKYYYGGKVTYAETRLPMLCILHLEPEFALLKLTQNSRIFENQSVTDIIKKVLADYSCAVDLKLSKTYPPLAYCVQYQESDFNFISRLLEGSGIFYYFVQTTGQEKLVLADQTNAYVEGIQNASFHSGTSYAALVELGLSMNMCPAQFTLNSYQFDNSKQKLKVEKTAKVADMKHQPFAVYHYMPTYATTSAGQDLVSTVAGSYNTAVQLLEGSSRYLDLTPAAKLNLGQEAQKIASISDWVILSLEFRFDLHAEVIYENRFRALPLSIAYQPPVLTPIPSAPSTQLAIVVGSDGAEYNTDQHGRLQVQFPWDLNPKTTAKSVWLRCISTWEGVFRVGTPVLVGFIDGEINAPIILGALHQDTLMPFSSSGDTQTKSVLVRRHPDSSVQKTYNSLTFDDKKDAQLVALSATKSMQVDVVQDFQQTVEKGIYHLKVKGDITVETEGNLIVKSKGAMQLTTEDAFELKAKTIAMTADQSIDIKASSGVSVDGGGQMKLKAGVIQQN